MAEVKCKVCNHPFPLTETFCPECGFERHVFPAPVSKEVEEYEKKRVEEYKGRREKNRRNVCDLEKQLVEKEKENSRIENERRSLSYQLDVQRKESKDSKEALEEMKKAYNAMASESKEETQRIKREREQYKTENDNISKDLALERNKNKELVADIQRMSSQIQSLTRENEKKSAELDLARKNPPVSAGAQIRIAENNGKYTLYDAAGVVHRANGSIIGKSGIELYDGYIFHIGELSFKVNTPDINIDNLTL